MGRCQGLPANQAPRPTCRIEAQKEHAEEPGERERKRIITGKMTGSGRVTDQITNGAQEDMFPQSTQCYPQEYPPEAEDTTHSTEVALKSFSWEQWSWG